MSSEFKGQLSLQSASRTNTESDSMILKWVLLLSVHHRIELSEQEVKIYLSGLREFGPKQLDEAFYLCRLECKFMPRIADVVERIKPETSYFDSVVSEDQNVEDKSTWKNLMAQFGERLRTENPEPMPGQRWTAEDGWKPREESWRLEADRDARKKPVSSWHAPIKGPNIRP